MTESLAETEEPVYAPRTQVATIPYGSQPSSIDRKSAESGESPPSRIEADGPDRVWIGYTGLMPIVIVNLKAGAVVGSIDLSDKSVSSTQKLALQLYGNYTRDSSGRFYVLMETSASLGHPAEQVILKLDASGAVQQELRLPGLASFQHQNFTVDASNRFWIGEDGTQVFTPDAQRLFHLKADGVLLRSGLFLSHGRLPLQLYGKDGSSLGPVLGTALSQPCYFQAQTSEDTVVRKYVSSPSGLLAQLIVRELYQLDAAKRTLELFDFLVYPRTIEPSHRGATPKPPDESPAPRGLRGLTFEDNGDILTIEDAERFNIYRHRRLSGPEAWRRKLELLPLHGLTSAEIDWYLAEFQARTGRLAPSHPLYPLFSRCRWFMKKNPETVSPTHDPTWQHLQQVLRLKSK